MLKSKATYFLPS